MEATLAEILSTTITPVATSLVALQPASWNPRTISEERFQNLCRSIEADPEFLWRRPVLAQGDGTIYAGNMRYRAAQHLGMETIPAIVEDVPDQLARVLMVTRTSALASRTPLLPRQPSTLCTASCAEIPTIAGCPHVSSVEAEPVVLRPGS